MNARGQGVVEMALGILVFVTVLIFGIHFAEVGYLSLKASEASAHATWDATGMRAHRFTGGPGVSEFYNSNQMRKGFPARNAEEHAQALYADFDGRSSSNGSTTLSQVFTRARGMAVSCRPDDVAVMPGNPGNIKTVFKSARANNREVDGQSCSAESMLIGYNIPRRFMEKPGNGFFKEQHYQPVGIKVCGMGRPRGLGGACQGRLVTALGDWGFAGTVNRANQPAEWSECNTTTYDGSGGGCDNKPYWRAVESLYFANNASYGQSSSQLATLVTASSAPADEQTFHMIFRGEYNNSEFTGGPLKEMHNEIPKEDGTPEVWEVTPSRQGSNYERAYQRRDECFLGLRCGQDIF